MVASLQRNFAELLEPDLLVDGAKPEQRAVYSGISRERYLAIDQKRRKDSSIPRLFYLTSGGIDKLELYTRFGIPEVWIWRREHLEVYGLAASMKYEKLAGSGLLPALNVALLEECVVIRSWQEARRRFRSGLSSRPA